MAKQGTILVVDDNRRILDALELLLGRYFAHVITASSPNLIDGIMRERGLQAGGAVGEGVDVVLLDMNFTAKINSGNEGLFWLDHIKKNYKGVEVVVFTAFAEIDLAVEAMRRGAFDFVVKPWDNEKLVGSLQRAYELSRENRGIAKGAGQGVGFADSVGKNDGLCGKSGMFWGRSAAMLELKGIAEKVAVTDANILITGENGTGKEVLAKEIHALSKRSGEAMVAVDMGAITETLFESELFGHVKGAFTDARTDRTGKFEAADGGTLFLDEIGNLQTHLQVKLLTVLQRGAVVRVGSNSEQKINVRMICATNCNLEQMVSDGTFREDLLYRINTIHLHIPPLRERVGDIVPLAQIFLKMYAQKYNRACEGFDIKAQQQMESYPWPGNIRELQHTVEKAVILSDGKELGVKDLMLKHTPTIGYSTLNEVEARAIKEAIARNNGNLSAVAEQLEITRQTLYNKIKKYGL